MTNSFPISLVLLLLLAGFGIAACFNSRLRLIIGLLLAATTIWVVFEVDEDDFFVTLVLPVTYILNLVLLREIREERMLRANQVLMASIGIGVIPFAYAIITQCFQDTSYAFDTIILTLPLLAISALSFWVLRRLKAARVPSAARILLWYNRALFIVMALLTCFTLYAEAMGRAFAN
jgi:hypothetical protein